MLVLAGCQQPKLDGIYVDCHSNGANTYWKWTTKSCELPGGIVTGCYELVAAEHLTECYGKEDWLTSDTGDSETGEPKGIAPANWPSHEPSLTFIRTACTEKCIYWHNEKSGQSYTCDDQNWVIFGYDEVLATALEDPSERNCNAESGKRDRSLATTQVIQTNPPPLWPSDNASIALACSTYQGCAALFDEDIMGHLAGDNEAGAAHLVTSSDSSSSSLTLGIANADLPSEDSNWVECRAEYTALDCGQSTCPFYLGNLSITNTSNPWDLHSEAENTNISVTNLHIQLLRPTLGVWRPATGELYLDPNALELSVDYDLLIDGEAAPSGVIHVTDRESLFGTVHAANNLEIFNLSMSEGDLTASAALHFDSVDGSPPIASFMLPPTVVLDPDAPGLLVSSILEHSTDPDDDPDWKLWLVDGQQVGPGYVIPPGLHMLQLEVRDSRFAFDQHEQLVMIEHGE